MKVKEIAVFGVVVSHSMKFIGFKFQRGRRMICEAAIGSQRGKKKKGSKRDTALSSSSPEVRGIREKKNILL